MNRMLGLMLLLCAGVSHADSQRLHVQANQHYSVPADTRELVLKELVLEDGATLLVPAAVRRLQISAAKARIGDQVKILAAGADGTAGVDGASQSAAAASCQNGAAGGDGKPGAAGEPGVALTLQLGIESLGSLLVDTHGGAGGKGGNGGNGQDAGAFEFCDAPAGGDGGVAGAGGNGGDGGSVLLNYRLLSASDLSASLANKVQVNNAGGAAAEAGTGGKGGAGSKGKYVTMRTLTGNQKWKAGGDDGNNGAAAKAGTAGAKGSVAMVNLGLTPVGAGPSASAAPTQKPDQSLDDMRRQLDLQSRRMEELSTKMERTVDLLEARIKALEKQVNGLHDH